MRYIRETMDEAAEGSDSERIKGIHAAVKRVKKSEKAGMKVMQRWEELVYEREDGKKEGKEEVNKLGVMMKEAGRVDEFMDSLSDKEFQEKLLVEFGLKEE